MKVTFVPFYDQRMEVFMTVNITGGWGWGVGRGGYGKSKFHVKKSSLKLHGTYNKNMGHKNKCQLFIPRLLELL